MTTTFQGNTSTSTGRVVTSCDNIDTGAPSMGPDSAIGMGPDSESPSTVPDAGSSVPTFDASAEAAAGFTPAAIQSKLTFWFDPTSLVQSSGKVATWTDLSGNGNHATQSNSAYQPAYTGAAINGLPSATFPGPITFLRIADVASMRWGLDDLLILVVFRATGQSATDCMLYQKTSPPPYDGVDLYLNSDKPAPSMFAGAQISGQVYVVSSAPPTTFVDGTVHVLGIRRAGPTLDIRVDGVLSSSMTNSTVAGVDVSAVGMDAIIGQNGYGSPPQSEFQQFHGDIAEEIGVNGSLSTTEIANLELYLKTRYAIP